MSDDGSSGSARTTLAPVSGRREKGAMANGAELPVAIIGAGVSGLSAAYRLDQAGIPVVCFESQGFPGGNIRTEAHDGFLYDLGPDSFLRTKVDGEDLCRELGLGDRLIVPKPGASLVHVVKDGVLYPMPEGLSLGVPRRAGPLLETPLLSGTAKLRALLEPFIPAAKGRSEESIFEFLSRRLGAEMAERLAAPLLSGVFAGDARCLSMNAAFPQLVALEKKHGSLFRGLNGGKSIVRILLEEAKAPESPFVSLEDGLGSLIDALVSALPADALHFGKAVHAIHPPHQNDPCPRLIFPGGEVRARHVIVAGPPWVASRLVENLSERAALALAKIRGFPTATVFFGLDFRQAHSVFEGSGFIVPPGEADILASTFVSSKWDHRAPPGKVLVRAFVGGGRKDIGSLTNGEVERVAHQELTRLLGDLGPVLFSRVHRYERGTPQPELGFGHVLDTIWAELGQFPWLSLIGSGYGGVGIPDCIRQGRAIATKILTPDQG